MNSHRLAVRGTRESLDNRGLFRWAIKQGIFVLMVAAALFLSAGNLIWAEAWIYLGLVVFIQILTALVLIPRSPDLLVERSQLGEGAKAWDVVLAMLMAYSTVFMALAAGLERRSGIAPVLPDMVTIIALIAAILGTLLTLWAMASNPFFSGVVRIQKERGHKVASAGPYGYVRHPGYAGMLVFTLASPFILCPRWVLLVAIGITILTVARTAFEDRTLQRELEGYAAYVQHVRYRLIPGIW